MKIYLAAEDREAGIRLANMINSSGNTCIVDDSSNSNLNRNRRRSSSLRSWHSKV